MLNIKTYKISKNITKVYFLLKISLLHTILYEAVPLVPVPARQPSFKKLPVNIFLKPLRKGLFVGLGGRAFHGATSISISISISILSMI